VTFAWHNPQLRFLGVPSRGERLTLRERNRLVLFAVNQEDVRIRMGDVIDRRDFFKVNPEA